MAMKKMLSSALVAMLMVVIAASCDQTKEIVDGDTTVKVTDVVLDRETISIAVGKTATLVATVLPEEATNKAVVWSSGNEAAVVVDDLGVLTAVAPGEATVTATTEDGGFPDECVVTVREPDVYVGGFVTGEQVPQNAAYWKNGEVTVLSTRNSYVTGLFVTDDGDVYATGFESGDQTPVPVPYAVVWVNGEVQRLGHEVDMRSTANAVFVAGDDVYVAGFEHIPDAESAMGNVQIAMLWKNGEPVQLSDQYSEARSVYVEGEDVYVVGRNSFDVFNASFATVWKNGEITQLEASPSAAYGVWVSDGDVHIAGVQNAQYQFALYWKNGVVSRLVERPSAATSIFVSGDDVYAGGQTDYTAVLWKNGEQQQLSTDYYTSANAVYGFNGDIYAAGSTGFQMTSGACFWKNGEVTKLGTPGTYAYAIFVN